MPDEDDASVDTSMAARDPALLLRRELEAERGIGPVLFWAVAVGLLAGGAGAALRWSIRELARTLGSTELWTDILPDLPGLVPVSTGAAFISLSVYVVRRFAPEAGGSGVQEIEGALDGVRELRWRRVLPIKFAGGVLSLASGLALGREGPTIHIGGALGRMLAHRFNLSAELSHTLIAAGAGAGLSAAFNAPLAGFLFVLEEMRPQFHYSVLSVQAVLIACACSDAVVRLLLGGAFVVAMPVEPTPPVATLWLFLAFGILVGLVGFAFNAILLCTMDLFDAVPVRARVAAAGAVGGALGLVLYLWPDAAGGGYQTLHDAFAGIVPVDVLLLLFVARFMITAVSYGTGAPGGIFAPMLALGTLLGLSFGHTVQSWMPGLVVSPSAFAVAGMGALFAATVRAPLTGIALAIELTGNFGQILPLMFACVAATLVAHGLGGRPIYTLLLERVLGQSDDKSSPSGD